MHVCMEGNHGNWLVISLQPPASSSSLVSEIAKARQHIQNSLKTDVSKDYLTSL